MRNHVIFCVMFLAISISPTHQSHNSGTIQFPSEATYGTSNEFSVQKRHVYDEGEDCDIVFPDKVKGSPANPCRLPTYSAKGKGRQCIQGVCKEALDYPYEHIQRIKNKLSGYLNLFGNLDGTKILTSKFGEKEPFSLCPATVHTIYPKTLKNDKDVEKFIVNAEGHTQGLVLETCQEKATCMFAPLFPNTYTSQCTQRYSTRRLMALNEDGNPAFDSFVVPSCCTCTVKQIKT